MLHFLRARVLLATLVASFSLFIGGYTFAEDLPSDSNVLYVIRDGFGTIVSSTDIIEKGTLDIQCGMNCVARPPLRSKITLEALPDPGYSFLGWRYSCRSSKQSSCTLSMNGGVKIVTGVFGRARTAVNGECGSANGQIFSSTPGTNLCKAGNASSVTFGNNIYTWSCSGQNGGSSASCRATKSSPPPEGKVGPDLVITSMSISPTSPKVGDSVRVSLTFKNQGNSDLAYGTNVAAAITEGSDWRTWAGYYAGIKAGESVVVTTEVKVPNTINNGGNWVPRTGGNITLGAYVDDINLIPNELDETNNRRSLLVRVESNANVISGSCGPSQNSSTTQYPTGTQACTTGVQQGIDAEGSDGTFNWNCLGQNGGNNASCSARKTTTPPNYTYSWSSGNWGNCSATCGGGTQTRSVSCVRNDGATVAESFCTSLKPSSSQNCNTQACGGGHTMTYVNPALVPGPRAGSSTFDIARTGEMPYSDGDGIGAFRNVCQYSHMNFDDAIIYPGQQGKAHLHTYWGNTGVDYRTTSESLISSGNGTCRGGTANRSAYWVPAMIDTRDGRPMPFKFVNVYYKSAYGGIRPEQVNPWPEGFKMIAGNGKSMDGNHNVVYVCDGNWSTNSRFIPNCSRELEMRVFFPQCWDGKNLDSPDHMSHVAFPVNGGCPSSHPVATAELSYHIIYDAPNGTSTWRLSSDMEGAPAGSSGHADWMHGWNQEIMNTWVNNVVKKGLSGGSHIVGDGRVMTCNFAGCF